MRAAWMAHGLKRAAAGLLAASLLATSLTPALALPSGSVTVLTTLPAGSYPAGLVYGPQGKYWFSLAGSSEVAEWLPSSGTLVMHALGESNAEPRGIAIGPDMNLWIAEKGAGKIARLEPGGALTEYALPSVDSQPSQIISGQDGSLYVTQFNSSSLAQVSVEGEVVEYVTPTANSKPLGLASDLDGNIWFTEWNGYNIGKLTPAGEMTEYSIPTPPSRPSQIILGPDGGLWFTYEQYKGIGRVDPTDGTVVNFRLLTASSTITSLALGADGRIWFLGVQTAGSFLAGAGGPTDLVETSLPTTIFEGEGGNQIIAGQGPEMVFVTSNTQGVYEIGPVSTLRRDLQAFIVDTPPFLMAGGPFTVDTRLANWSSAAATDSVLTFTVSEGLEFVSADSPTLTCATLDAQTMQCVHASLPGNSVAEVLFTILTTRAAVPVSPAILDLQVESAEEDYLPANNRTFRQLETLQQYVYQTDFSAGSDSFWSKDTVAEVEGQNALGLFDNQRVTLQLPEMPPHDRASVCFDLYVMGQWDGSALVDPADPTNPPPIIGPDIWANYMNDTRLFVSSFSNRPGFVQSFPKDYGEAEFAPQTQAAETGEFDGDPATLDARYYLCTTQLHDLEKFIMTFYGLNLDGPGGEKWALDNVFVRIYYKDAFDYVFLPVLLK
ncbi:MAG: hypothetical protein JW987_05340 [Anaerolineaceae bacterium]|nr:hypothetical protein [Anaerolineaceae bacterium]